MPPLRDKEDLDRQKYDCWMLIKRKKKKKSWLNHSQQQNPPKACEYKLNIGGVESLIIKLLHLDRPLFVCKIHLRPMIARPPLYRLQLVHHWHVHKDKEDVPHHVVTALFLQHFTSAEVAISSLNLFHIKTF